MCTFYKAAKVYEFAMRQTTKDLQRQTCIDFSKRKKVYILQSNKSVYILQRYKLDVIIQRDKGA